MLLLSVPPSEAALIRVTADVGCHLWIFHPWTFSGGDSAWCHSVRSWLLLSGAFYPGCLCPCHPDMRCDAPFAFLYAGLGSQVPLMVSRASYLAVPHEWPRRVFCLRSGLMLFFLVIFRNSHFNNDCPAEGSGLMCLSLELTVFSCVFSLGRRRGLHVLGLERAGRSPGRLSFTEPRIVAFRMRVPTYVGASISCFYCCLCFVIIGI